MKLCQQQKLWDEGRQRDGPRPQPTVLGKASVPLGSFLLYSGSVGVGGKEGSMCFHFAHESYHCQVLNVLPWRNCIISS